MFSSEGFLSLLFRRIAFFLLVVGSLYTFSLAVGVPKELKAKPEDAQEEAASRIAQAKTEPHTYYAL